LSRADKAGVRRGCTTWRLRGAGEQQLELGGDKEERDERAVLMGAGHRASVAGGADQSCSRLSEYRRRATVQLP